MDPVESLLLRYQETYDLLIEAANATNTEFEERLREVKGRDKVSLLKVMVIQDEWIKMLSVNKDALFDVYSKLHFEIHKMLSGVSECTGISCPVKKADQNVVLKHSNNTAGANRPKSGSLKKFNQKLTTAMSFLTKTRH